MTRDEIRALIAVLGGALEHAASTGRDDISIIEHLAALDDAARADLEAAIERAKNQQTGEAP